MLLAYTALIKTATNFRQSRRGQENRTGNGLYFISCEILLETLCLMSKCWVRWDWAKH